MPAFAQQAAQTGEPSLQLEEIVVNARRISENLQRVPIAISAMSTEQISQYQFTDISALANRIPSLNMCCNQGNTSYGFLRGATGVAYYFNDMPVGSVGSGGFGNFFDVQNVQVLKGPQGTLFGTASNAGAVLYNAVRPGFELQGYASGTLGSYGRTVAEGAITIPLIDDKLSIRLAGKTEHRDGTWKLLSHPGLSIEDRNFSVYRASVVFKPTDRIENYTMFNYYKDRSIPMTTGPMVEVLPSNYIGANRAPGRYFGFYGAGNSAPAGRVPNAENNYNANLFDWMTAENARPGGAFDYKLQGLSFIPSSRNWRMNITNHTTVDLTDDVTLKNIFGYMKRFGFAHTDGDATPFNISETGGVPSRPASPISNWTDEIQLQGSTFDSRLKFTLGTFWYGPASWGSDLGRSHSRSTSETAGPTTGNATVTKTGERGHAIYGQATYDMSETLEGLSLTAGYRYSWDRAQSNQWVFPALLNQPGCVIQPQSGQCFTSGNTPLVTRTGSGEWKKGSYTLSAQYQLDANTMLFITNSKGSSAGGLQLAAPVVNLRTFGPASLTNFEGGVKSEFNVADAIVRFNATLFYGLYDDIAVQVLRSFTDPLLPPTAVITENAAKAKMSGIDFETTIIPTDWLELTANGAYNRFAFSEWVGINSVTGKVEDLKSTKIQFTPKFKFSVGAAVILPVPERLGEVKYSVDFTHNGVTFVSLVPRTNALDFYAGITNPQYTNMDMGIIWDRFYGSDGLSLNFYMTNVLKGKTVTGTNGGIFAAGYNMHTKADPRMYGVTAKYAF